MPPFDKNVYLLLFIKKIIKLKIFTFLERKTRVIKYILLLPSLKRADDVIRFPVIKLSGHVNSSG